MLTYELHLKPHWSVQFYVQL